MHIGKYIHRYKRSFVLKIALISVSTTLAVLLVVGLILWTLRVPIIRHIASLYTQTSVVSENSTISIPDKVETPEVDIAPSIAKDTSEKQISSLVEDAVAKANPAVVAIAVSQDVPKYEISYRNISPIDGVTMQIPEQKQVGTEKQVVGRGSGFIVSSDGIIITNRHVALTNGTYFDVTLSSGKEYSAVVLGRDAVLDIAVLKITGTKFPYVSLGDSDTLRLGQSVIAIGNALGQFQNTVSVGIVSGLSRSITASGGGQTEYLDKVIQTDAAINPGNSGGPLLNTKGEVVGVNVAIVQGSQNIGFSIPINSVKGIISSIKKTGTIERPYLGVRYIPITKEVQQTKSLSVDHGFLLASDGPGNPAIAPGSPAEKAGLKEGDVILQIDGKDIVYTDDLASLVRQKNIGDYLPVKIFSNGIEKNLSILLTRAG